MLYVYGIYVAAGKSRRFQLISQKPKFRSDVIYQIDDVSDFFPFSICSYPPPPLYLSIIQYNIIRVCVCVSFSFNVIICEYVTFVGAVCNYHSAACLLHPYPIHTLILFFFFQIFEHFDVVVVVAVADTDGRSILNTH